MQINLSPREVNILYIALDKEVIELLDRQADGERVGHSLAAAQRIANKMGWGPFTG